MSEIETIVNQFINSNNTGEINPTTVSHIIIWTLLIVILISFGLAIIKGGGLAGKTVGEQILVFLKMILLPITFILNKIKRFIFFFLPLDSKQFFNKEEPKEAAYIGQAWNTHNRLSTIVITTTIIMLCFSGYMTFNPGKFPSIYGKILTYVAGILALFFLLKSVLLFTKRTTQSADELKQSFDWEGSSHKKKFEEQRSWLLNNTLNYLKIGSIAIVSLAILGIALFFITSSDDGRKYANTILTWLGILVVGLFAYSYLKKLPFMKYLLNNKLFSLIYHVLFLIPCFILEFIEAIHKELKFVPKVAWWILLIELVLIMVYVIGPIISKTSYLNVHSKDVTNGGVRFKQEIIILKEANKNKLKEIDKIKKSDDPKNEPFKQGNLPIGNFWDKVMYDMLWIGDQYYKEEINNLNVEKSELQKQQKEEEEAARKEAEKNDYEEKQEQSATSFENNMLNENLTKKIDNIDNKIKDFKLQSQIQPKKEELEQEVINVLWEDAYAKGLLEKPYSKDNSIKHSHIYDSFTEEGMPFKASTEKKETHYDNSIGVLDFLGTKDPTTQKYSKVEEYVEYIQTEGAKIDNIQREIQNNNEKIQIVQGKIGKKDGHPKTVVLVNGPVTLQTKYNPPGGKYPRARFVRKVPTNDGSFAEMSVTEYEGDYNYDFAISSWFFIHAQASNFYLGKNKSKNIIQWSNNSFQILYNTNDNSLEIKTKNSKKVIKIKNILLQKWINLVINYDGGHLDVFLDGKLVKTVPQVVHIMPDTLSMKIGQKNGIRGGICNIVHFASHLTKNQLINNYEAYKDKDPPNL
jgi:hypothetical protein